MFGTSTRVLHCVKYGKTWKKEGPKRLVETITEQPEHRQNLCLSVRAKSKLYFTLCFTEYDSTRHYRHCIVNQRACYLIITLGRPIF